MHVARGHAMHHGWDAWHHWRHSCKRNISQPRPRYRSHVLHCLGQVQSKQCFKFHLESLKIKCLERDQLIYGTACLGSQQGAWQGLAGPWQGCSRPEPEQLVGAETRALARHHLLPRLSHPGSAFFSGFLEGQTQHIEVKEPSGFKISQHMERRGAKMLSHHL